MPDSSDFHGSRAIAQRLAKEFRAAAQQAFNEEDLRVTIEAKLGDALRHLGIPSQPSYERTYANHGGRSDAVYGRVVIEYEAAGSLGTAGGVEHAAEQLERYLRAEVEGSSESDALKRVVGVGIDGHNIFFLRFRQSIRENDWGLFVAPGQKVLPLEDNPTFSGNLIPILEGPYTVTTESVQTFLLYLRAASRSRLTPEGLAKQFGPNGPCASSIVATLANLLQHHDDDPQVRTFFDEWDRIFGIVYGVELQKANRHLPILQRSYGLTGDVPLKIALFALHTYYALLMKLLAAELVAMQRESLIDSFLSDLPSASEVKIRDAIETIESGRLFAHFAVQNFLEADFFGWYQIVWCEELCEAVREMVRLLVSFEPATGVLDPSPTQDLLKRLYQLLIPREIRHDLGEFYTPTWLADLLVCESGYNGALGRRVLDPACGSGTFLVATINRIRSRARDDRHEPAVVAKSIIRDVVGFELNPLGVIAARTNYLLALGPLLRELPLVEIPVYLCDSILLPNVDNVGLEQEYKLRTSVGVFTIPVHVVETRQLANLTGLLDRCLYDSYTVDEFCDVLRAELPGMPDLGMSTARSLYIYLVELALEGRDGVWARVIRNAFAPLLCGLFDFVIGNPPWVNWESLARDYRTATLRLWSDYGLFSLSGHAARLGGGKKDISALMLYRCADVYLKDGGCLGFLLTQTLFKSKGAGDGFRRFQLGERAKLGVKVVHDLTKLKPFEDANNQTAAIVLHKNTETTYPIRYVMWQKKGRIASISTTSLAEIKEACELRRLAASPVDSTKVTSPWLTVSVELDAAIRGIPDKSPYKPFVGVCTWANGIYWINIREKAANGLLRIRNRAEEAKEKNIEAKDALVERTYVYPLVRSRDIVRWGARPSTYILVPQDPIAKKGVPESTLRVYDSRTYRFLKSFEDQLSKRSGMLKYFDASKGDAFYSVYNVAGHTFSDYKVMWRQMLPLIVAAVIEPQIDNFLGSVPIVTQHVVSVIATETADEAHYVCAMLNSSVTTAISASYSTGKSYGTPSMLDYVPIPRFDAQSLLHQQLVILSRRAHETVAGGGSARILETEVDEVSAQVFGVDSSRMSAVTSFVSSLRRVESLADPVNLDTVREEVGSDVEDSE